MNKKRLLSLTGVLIGLVVFGIGLKTCKTISVQDSLQTTCQNYPLILFGIIIILLSVITIMARKE